MIRINLAAGGRKRGRTPAGAGAAWRAATLSVAIVLLALVWAGWQVRALHEGGERVARETLATDRALQELAPVMARLAALEAQNAHLAARAGVVAAWRKKRYAVARLLTEVGRGVPDGMQLTELRQEPGAIVLGGRAAAVALVSEFAANLELAEQVVPPVEIIDTQAEGADRGEAVRFSIRARLSSPAP